MRRWLVLAALTSLSACEADVADARSQWEVTLGTDAPVPQLGDRIFIELLDREGRLACGGCRREFGITPELDGPDAPPPTFPLSFGVVPDDGIDRVRVRLYRTGRVGADGLPLGDHIDAVARFPEAEGITKVSLPLTMRCFGVVGDAEAQTTCDPRTGELGAVPTLGSSADVALPETGSWAPAVSVPCQGAVSDEMVCIEGAAFLIGAEDPFGGVGATTSLPERLLRVAPFAIDRIELTVRELRDTGLASAFDPTPRDEEPTLPYGLCTFPSSREPVDVRDAFPVDCISHELAAAVCASKGKRLPSEDEWELAAGGRSREYPFPWGTSDAQTCEKAVLARGRTALEQEVVPGIIIEEFGCRDGDPGPKAGGSPLDITAEGVRDMAGNLDEWVADGFALYDDPCWIVPAGEARPAPCPLLAPVAGAPHAVRGGSYIDPPAAARVTSRKSAPGGRGSPGRGFRCAKSM